MHLEMSSTKRCLFLLGLNMIITTMSKSRTLEKVVKKLYLTFLGNTFTTLKIFSNLLAASVSVKC